MTNLRLNRDTKVSAFFRNEIDKFVRKSCVKKRNKDKILAFRDSSMRDSRSLRDFVFESESQFESSSQSELAVDSFTVASVAFVAFVVSIASVVSIVSVSIDNATLLKMLFQLFSFSSETTFSSIDSVATSVAISVAISVATFVTNSFSIDSITIFVAFVIVSIVTFEMIEVVDDSNMNDIDVLLKKYDRAQTKLLRSDFDAYDQNRVQEETQIYVNVFSLSSSVSARFSVSVRFIRVDSLFIIITRIFRISTKRRFKILIVSKTDEFSRDARDVMNDDDDEAFDVNDDNRSNCIRCCRISIDCRRIASIVCDRCFRQKIACISIRFEFVY
jgi:hypothetical protein